MNEASAIEQSDIGIARTAAQVRRRVEEDFVTAAPVTSPLRPRA
jgi:hypothetical protein